MIFEKEKNSMLIKYLFLKHAHRKYWEQICQGIKQNNSKSDNYIIFCNFYSLSFP